jgi:hypothetical protein
LCAVDADEQVELPLGSLNLGDIRVKEADRIALEALSLRPFDVAQEGLVALDVRQTGYAVPLQAAVQRIEAIIQLQQCAPECDDRRLLSFGEGRGVRAFGPVFRSSTVARLRHCATVFGLIPSSRSASRAKLAIAVCCSDGVRGRGTPVTYLSDMAFFHFNERIGRLYSLPPATFIASRLYAICRLP